MAVLFGSIAAMCGPEGLPAVEAHVRAYTAAIDAYDRHEATQADVVRFDSPAGDLTSVARGALVNRSRGITFRWPHPAIPVATLERISEGDLGAPTGRADEPEAPVSGFLYLMDRGCVMGMVDMGAFQ